MDHVGFCLGQDGKIIGHQSVDFSWYSCYNLHPSRAGVVNFCVVALPEGSERDSSLVFVRASRRQRFIMLEVGLPPDYQDQTVLPLPPPPWPAGDKLVTMICSLKGTIQLMEQYEQDSDLAS